MISTKYTMHFILLCSCLQFCGAFLLEQNAQKTDNTCVTASKFLESQEYLENGIEHLRKNMKETNALLVKQLNQKVLEIGNKINDTTESSLLDKMERKYQSLEYNYTSLLYSFNKLQKQNEDFMLQLGLCLNKTDSNERQIVQIKQLKNIQAIQDLQTLKQNVQKIDAQTNDLSRLQLARNQDFLALYNKTENMKQVTNDHLQKIENEHTMSFENITNLIKKVKDDIVQNETVRLDALEKRLTEINRTVALTACANSNQIEKAGYIVKFASLKYQTGITDISSFRTNGKFTCEQEGIYIITVTITSFRTVLDFFIHVNGISVERRYVEHQTSVYYTTATASLVYKLKVNDTVWVYLNQDMYVNSVFSCFTIIKIR